MRNGHAPAIRRPTVARSFPSPAPGEPGRHDADRLTSMLAEAIVRSRTNSRVETPPEQQTWTRVITCRTATCVIDSNQKGRNPRHMAEGRNKPLSGNGESSTPAPELVLDEPLSAGAPDDLPFPMQLPPAMFSGPGLLTLADLLPVMTAFVDRDLVYRFMNKPLGEWLGRPRRDVIAKHMREVLGERAFA